MHTLTIKYTSLSMTNYLNFIATLSMQQMYSTNKQQVGNVQQRYGVQKHGEFVVLDQLWVCVRPMPTLPTLIPSIFSFYQFRENLAHQLIMRDARQIKVDCSLGDNGPHSCVYSTKNNRQCGICKATTKVHCKCREVVCNPFKKSAANQPRQHRKTCCYYINLVYNTKVPKCRHVIPKTELQEVVLLQE